MIVQRFGMDIFNEGLRHTLRLPFQEFEEQSSGEILAVLVKVRSDTEKFITSFINVLFSSLVGVGFLLWYAMTKHWALIPCFLCRICCPRRNHKPAEPFDQNLAALADAPEPPNERHHYRKPSEH
jgi:ABC-type bacteriocin/lantibiotic exporter with double-glycine peptidase domain